MIRLVASPERSPAIDTRMLPNPNFDARRRVPRFAICADVALSAGAVFSDARILNISSEGFMAETKAALGAGASVTVDLPGAGLMHARIVWARGGQVGGQFAGTIDPLEVFHALGASERVP